MDQAGPRPQARPPVGNIVQALVERSFAWATRCRRLVKDYERYAETLAGFHVIAFVGYMLKHAALLLKSA
jgi:Transposase DDE domain